MSLTFSCVTLLWCVLAGLVAVRDITGSFIQSFCLLPLMHLVRLIPSGMVGASVGASGVVVSVGSMAHPCDDDDVHPQTALSPPTDADDDDVHGFQPLSGINVDDDDLGSHLPITELHKDYRSYRLFREVFTLLIRTTESELQIFSDFNENNHKCSKLCNRITENTHGLITESPQIFSHELQE